MRQTCYKAEARFVRVIRIYFRQSRRLPDWRLKQLTVWGKGIGYSAGDQITGPSDHAWNAVKINGAWYLLDSTWGAGYTDEQNNFVFDFDDEYFLMPPEQFIYTHFPEDAKWQLLSTPISNNEFADLPDVQRRFFSYD